MPKLERVGSDFDRSWLPAWAKRMPILKYGDKNPPYTSDDFQRMPIFEEDRVELMDGLFVEMPSPTSNHAGLEWRLAYLIGQYLEDKPGEVFTSNFAVRLFPHSTKKEDRSTISPDVTVVLDPARINEEGCQGAPNFVIEILSPSDKKRDLVLKLEKYQEAGVGEYWIVDPEAHMVQVNLLKDGEYVIHAYDVDTTPQVPVKTLPGLEINFAAVFASVAAKTGVKNTSS
jgi:Uma2 family endonuclease